MPYPGLFEMSVSDFDPSLFSDSESVHQPAVRRKRAPKTEKPAVPGKTPATDKKRKIRPPPTTGDDDEEEAYIHELVKEMKRQQQAQKRAEAKEKRDKAREQNKKDVQTAIRLGRETTTEDNIVTPEPLVKKEAEVKVHNRKRVRVAKNEGKDILTRTYVIKLYPVRPSDDEQENQEGSDLIIQTSSHTLEPDTTSSSSPSTE